MSFQTELGPLDAVGVTDPAVRQLEADMLEVQSCLMNVGLRPAVADLIECVKLVREARKGVRIGLLRAWEGATEDERDWLLNAIGVNP
jgi:hypothetical protein